MSLFSVIKKCAVLLRVAANSRFVPEHPLCSVIIPVYDRTEELKQAIESVLSQTFHNFELLLVCDGSPGETRAVVEAYRADPHVRIFHFNDNTGSPCRGRNKGIEMARGDIIVFLDSDDIAMPDRLRRSVFTLWLTETDLVYGAVKFMADGSRMIPGIQDGQILRPSPFDLESAKASNPVITSAVAVRKACLERHGAFRVEMKYREDHELWLRLAFQGCRFFAAPEVVSCYRLHRNNAELRYLQEDEHWKGQMLELYSKSFTPTSLPGGLEPRP